MRTTIVNYILTLGIINRKTFIEFKNQQGFKILDSGSILISASSQQVHMFSSFN